MTKPFATRSALVATMMMLVSPAISAQHGDEALPPSKPGKPINTGDVLSGELNAMKVRDVKNGKRVATYQITSEPRRLPPPNGLCNLETGPETFQLVTSSDAQAAQLKSFVGKEISVKVDEIACASDAGQMSEAVITKWSLIKKQ
ncbi:hypothetical protein IVA78_04130 [Bradyrhizobium sp. 137]|uniref:hypothetical protein n=1 Tax=Bradyrhizobium sp. 137 TaxID=2782614 RepID=UPI001FF756F1|nr:hypothetical protein [Bradyrhizobium sp. 137]MCK1754412.1 hypothetical protein [Bradyrhizobium sp. 137]